MFTGGIGIVEIFVFALVSLITIAVPVAIVMLLVMLVRKQNKDDKSPAYSELATENQRLRDQLSALKNSSTP